MTDRPPRHDLLRYFQYDHLPPHLQDIARPLAFVADQMVAKLKHSPEVTAGLRKLLEAKDCFVRAGLDGVIGSDGK